MASTIKNFLVGVGLDTTEFDKGSKEVQTGLSRFRSLAGFAGAAMVGAFATAGTAAIAAGQRIDKLALSTEKFSASSQFIYDYGNALRSLGGSADEAITAVATIDKALDALRAKGEFGAFSEAAFSGADVAALSRAQNAEEFLRISAEIVPTLNEQQQRLFQESFGFSDATMRSLREGSAAFDAMIARAGSLASGFNEAIESSREFNKELTEFQLRLEGIGNALAGPMLDGFTNIMQSVNGFIDRNKSFIDDAAKFAGENATGATIATAGAATMAAGSLVKGVGLRGLGTGLTRLGTPGLVIGGGMIAADAAMEQTWGDWWDQSKRGASDLWRRWTAPDMSHMPDAPYGPEVPGMTVPPERGGWLPVNTENVNPQAEAIRAGGTLTNSDAAQSSPEVILMNRASEAPKATPAPRVQNNLDIKLQMDGRDIETKVVEVIERREEATIESIQSTTVR